MEISVSNPLLYFKLFYLLAFVLIFSAVIIISLRRGYHLKSVLLMLTTITLLTVIGSRLFTIPINDWVNIMNPEVMQQYNNRSAIGGLLFGLMGVFLAQRLFGFGRSLLELYAWIGPIALGVQKLGCFINSCCFGRPSDLFWSVQYPKGSHVHFNQWSANLIDANAPLSLSVHPVQIYEFLGLALIGYVIWRTRHLWKKNACAMFFSLFLFFVFRFCVEFIRDPASSQFNENYIWGLRVFQWLMLGIGLLFGLFLLIYERYLKRDAFQTSKKAPYVSTEIAYIIGISLVIYVFSGLFTRYELMAVWIKFIPAVGLSIYFFLTNQSVRKFRVLGVSLFLIPIFVMAQTIQTDSTKVSYKRLDIGGSFGSFINEIRFNPRQGQCGGTSYSSEFYENTYSLGGAGLSQVSINKKGMTTYGINLHAGSISSTRLSTNEKESNFIFGANPFIKYDGNWVGIGAGFTAGNLKQNKEDKINESSAPDAHKDYHLLPEFYFRFGRPEYIDIDINRGFLFPSAYPSLQSRISVGSGFGNKRDYGLRVGRIYPVESNFISAEGLINKQFGLKLMYIFKGNNDFEDPNFSLDNKGKFVFGLNYRFDYKKNK